MRPGGRARTGGAAARRIHRQGDRARARGARPARLRPARHRRIGPAELPRARHRSDAQQRPGRAVRTVRACRSDPRGATTPRRNRSKTSRRSARPAATKSSSSTAPPTAPRSRWSTPNAIPQHVEALVLDSVVPTDGPEPFAIPTFQAISPVLTELCATAPAPGSRPIRSATSRAWPRSCAGTPQRARLRRLGPSARDHAERGRPARHPRGGRPEPRPARAAARRRAIGAAPRPRSAAAPAPALGGADPERAQRPAERRPAGDRRSAVRGHELRGDAVSVAAQRPADNAARRSARLPARPAAPRTSTRSTRPPRFADSLVPDCAGWPDASAAPPSASALAERAHPDPLRRAGPENPHVERAPASRP